MIKKMKTYSYEEACQALETFFTNYDPIVTVIQHKIHNFYLTIQAMEYLINLVNHNNQESDDDTEYHIFDPEIIDTLNQFNIYLPLWILRYDDLDWTKFLNVYMLIFENYISVQENLVPYILQDNDEALRLAQSSLTDLKENYKAVSRLVNLTITYEDLIVSASRLLDETSQYKDARPAAYKLSKLYIDTINKKLKEESVVADVDIIHQ